MTRRPLLFTPLLLTPFLLTSACGVVPSTEHKATDTAREEAGKVGLALYGQRPRTAEEVGRVAARMRGVEVLRLTGTSTHDGDGIDMIVRTSGAAAGGWPGDEEVSVRRCFTVRVSPKSAWGEVPRDVDCPDGPALAFAAPPEPPRLPYEELQAKLPRVPEGGRVEEAEVRRALASLDLPLTVRTEVKADGARVGVLLAVESNGFDPQDCLLARVSPGRTDVWTPPGIQRMPGEGGCTVNNALDPKPGPH
ncbi:translation initiation factor IF-2 [Kitasatospora sp. NPDC058170]|uniref:translation initiation factor IF-2 n=1 Tax=Kitasatospora sp. NPDC058170 TaxID=3346364 RepID=UPI0036DBF038